MADLREGVVYLNGRFVPESEAKVPVWDRGFSGGEGVYEVTRTFAHKPFKLTEHIQRLYRSLRYTRIDCGLAPDEMERLSLEILGRNAHFLGPDDDYAIWQIVSRGVQQATIGNKSPARSATVTIFCLPVAFRGFAKQYVEGVMLVTPSTRRIPPQSLEAKAKITNKMNHIVAAFEAQQVDPRCVPLMLDLDGNISETHLGNFFFIRQGTLCTSTDRTVLGGITRSTLMAMAAEAGIPVVEGNFTPFDVYNADEAFTASTSPTITPVKSLNGVDIGAGVPGPMTLYFMKQWNAMVGVDYVDQALAHLDGSEKQAALGAWAQIRGRDDFVPPRLQTAAE
jgi:branched-chain amino acid aminotransferase